MSSLFQDIANQKYELKDKTKSKNITPEEKTVAVREKMDNLIALGKNKQPTVSARSTTSTNLSNMTKTMEKEADKKHDAEVKTVAELLRPAQESFDSKANKVGTYKAPLSLALKRQATQAQIAQQADKEWNDTHKVEETEKTTPPVETSPQKESTSFLEKAKNTYNMVSQPVYHKVSAEMAKDNNLKMPETLLSPKTQDILDYGDAYEKADLLLNSKVGKALTTIPVALADVGAGEAKFGESLADFATKTKGSISKRLADAKINRIVESYNNAIEKYFEEHPELSEEKKKNIRLKAESAMSKEVIPIANQANENINSASEFIEKDLVGDKYNKDLETVRSTYSFLPEKGAEIARSVGYQLPSYIAGAGIAGAAGIPLTSAAGQAIGLVPFGVAAAGQGTEQALQQGATFEQANTYGNLSGMLETGVEALSGFIGGSVGNKFGAKILPKEVQDRIARNVIGKYGLQLLDLGLDVTGEGVEEVISEVVDPFLKRMTYDKDADLATIEDMQNAFWGGVYSSLVFAGGRAAAEGSTINNPKYKQMMQEQIAQSMQDYKNNSPQNANKPKTLEELIPTGKNVTQNDTQNVQSKQIDKTNQAESKTVLSVNMEQSKQNLIKDVENNKYLNEQEKKSFIDTINEIEYTEDVEKDVRRTMNVFEEERGLKNITNNFNETKPTYNKYAKDNVEYDKQYIDLAKDSVKANNSGKRTKEQWLQVAKNLGNQIYEMSDAEVEKQAFKSWIDNRPNNANALNKQGKKYVKFTMDDWVNQVYDTVRAARNNAQQVVDNKALQTTVEKMPRDTVYSMKKETPKNKVSNLKQKQLDIVKAANPMTDDYHTGIRNVEDIKSFNETLNDKESFTYGDFTREDALKAVEKGEVKVYSSKPIANGGFVSTSYNMAKDYAGSGKVYSETVPLTDVAWINGDEGQLARVENSQVKEYNKNDPLKKYEDLQVGETTIANVKDLLSLYNGGGYRPEEEVADLRRSIQEKGIKEPIKIFKDGEGNLRLEDGNHRLQLAKELGIEIIPIKMAESWENILSANTKKEVTISESAKGDIYNDEFTERNSTTDEKSRSTKGSMPEVNVVLGDGNTAKRDDRVSKAKPESDQFRRDVQDKRNNRKIENSNKSSFSMPENTTDNKGRKLSKQQQEYFKDSKVRDENGNLLEVYHGTEANAGIPQEYWFTKFDLDKARVSTMGDGFYFTESYDRASSYAHTKGNVYKVYLNIKKPFIKDNNQTFQEAVQGINPDYDIEKLHMQGNKHFDGTKLREYLIKNGYDGISLDGTYVAFYPNQIKNVDNTNPTTDEDIRKFKSSENGKPYMDLNGHISMDNNSNVERVGLSQIEKAINDIVTTKVGKFRQKAYGIYKNGAEIIRLKEKNDVPVALHELTHHLDKKYGLSDLGKFDDELMNIAVADKNATRNTKIAEGVAEFGRYYMTDKEYAKFIAPKYYEAFEEALAKEPEMKNNVEKLQQMVSDYLNQSPLNRMASHIDFGDEEASLWQKSKSKISEFKKNFRKNFVDELDPMKKIVNDITNGKKLNVEEDPTELMRLLNGVTGKVRVALEYGIVDNNGNKIGKSLKEIINPVANNMEEFIAYTSALRARDLANNNMESGFNPKDVDEIINLYQNNTTFNKAAKELYKFQNNILEKTLVDSGIITKEAMEAYNKNNPHYVPFYRVMDENFKQGKDSLSKKPKKIKGSTRDIINPIESIIKNTYSYTLIAEKNKIYKTLFDMAKKYDGTGKWFDKVPTDMVGETVSAKDVKDILEKLNLDREDIDYNEVFTTIFKPSYNQKGNIITVMEKGKPVHYEINDKELYDILAPAYNNKKENLLLDLLNRGASALRVGATHSLEFVFRNPLRDTFTAGAFSENGFIPLVDTIRGIFEVAGKTDLYYKWLEGGGSGSTYTNAQRTTLKNTLKDILPEATRKNNSTMEKTLDILLNTTKHPLRTYLDVVGSISNMMEEGTRVGEFRRAYNKTNSIKKSALDSRDITVDFSRGGVTGKEINKYVAFLNANIQGLDKTVRSFKDRPFATSMKVLAMLTLPSILLRLLQDPDDMDKIAQWEKDTYWVFYVNGVPIKIPKPQGPIQMFATLPERVIDFIRTKDSHALDGLIERTMSSSSPVDSYTSLIPTGAQPIIENATNYSFFRQQPIVKQSLQSRSPKYQYDENTSTIAKMVGGATNTSPKKIDNLVSGYFGNLGKDAVNIAGLPIDMVNLLVNGTGKKKEYNNLNSTLRKLPLIKGFVANDTYSKALDNFYDEKSRVSTAYTDAKFVYGDHPTSEQSKELEQLKELNSKYNKTYNEIKKINEQIDNVKQSNYSNKQKESMINISKEEIDKKAKDLEKETEELKKSIKRLK